MLLVGEVFLDVTITSDVPIKMRLGGIVHAARGLWAQGLLFAAAVCLPRYLEGITREYLEQFGCQEFFVFAYVDGAPNITLILDATEVSDQGYETLLRDEKKLSYQGGLLAKLREFKDILIFPGKYELSLVVDQTSKDVRLYVDVAYDVEDFDHLVGLERPIDTIFISTSSVLFERLEEKSLAGLIDRIARVDYKNLLLKENRGGSRLFEKNRGAVEHVPAQLGITKNSVGVGDVFDSAFLAHQSKGAKEAAWRASSASTAYAFTTEPAIFRQSVERSNRLQFAEQMALGGVFLPWEVRQNFKIYLAAPDFTYVDRGDVIAAISALSYHNFIVRRPVQENGELPENCTRTAMRETYVKDTLLLRSCDLLFAVPNYRDAGTLVEIGMALMLDIPVIVYDSKGECMNPMVVSGAASYSTDLDQSLNSVFASLSRKWMLSRE